MPQACQGGFRGQLLPPIRHDGRLHCTNSKNFILVAGEMPRMRIKMAIVIVAESGVHNRFRRVVGVAPRLDTEELM